MFKKEELQNKTLAQLLRIYVQADKLANEKNQIGYFEMVEGVILTNFSEKPTIELRRAYDAVDAMNLPDKVKEVVKQSKFCAFQISQHLDPMHIDGMPSLKRIVEEQINLAEAVIKNIKE